jgi:hypothetical protein
LAQSTVGMNHRPFIGCDRVSAAFQRRANVVNRRLPIGHAQRRRLKQHICPRLPQPLVWGGHSCPPLLTFASLDELLNIQSTRIRYPSHPSRRNSCNSPRDPSVPQFAFFSSQQAQQRAIDIAKPKQAEVIGVNGGLQKRLRGHKAHGRAGQMPALQQGQPIMVVCSGWILYMTLTSPACR